MHRRLRPVVKAMKAGTRATIPAWQRNISASAVDMESYEGIEVTGEADQDDLDLDVGPPNGQEDTQPNGQVDAAESEG